MYVGINRKKREEKEGERRESREEEWKRRGAGEIRRKVLGEESERRRGGGRLSCPSAAETCPEAQKKPLAQPGGGQGQDRAKRCGAAMDHGSVFVSSVCMQRRIFAGWVHTG